MITATTVVANTTGVLIASGQTFGPRASQVIVQNTNATPVYLGGNGSGTSGIQTDSNGVFPSTVTVACGKDDDLYATALSGTVTIRVLQTAL